MPTAHVVHAEHDRSTVEDEIVPTLAIHGFRSERDCADASTAAPANHTANPSLHQPSDLFVIIVSKQALACTWMTTLVRRALRSNAMVLPLLLDETSPLSIHEGLAGRVHADFRTPGPVARHQLANLLPRCVDAEPVDIPDWNEHFFCEQLARAARTLQFEQAVDLIDTATQQIDRGNLEYSPEGACNVLEVLATNRYWGLIRRFADTLITKPALQQTQFRRLYERLIDEEQQALKWLDGTTEVQTRGIALDAPGDRPTAADNRQMQQILLRANDPAWTAPHIPDLTVTSRLGTIFACNVSAASLSALRQDRRVLSFDRSQPVALPECDRSVPFVRGHAVHRGQMTEHGDQALVAIIDDGIDPLHEAFMDAQGHSRIVAVWDQRDDSGYPPASFEYGTEYRKNEIDHFVTEQRLPESWPLGRHGTHVTSIAAGRALEDGFAGGMAPQARIVMVVPRIETHGCAFSYVNALRYIDRISRELDLPVVVNISFGENTGAHDGSSHLEGGVDAFSKGGRQPGRVVVTSAGNERGKRTHAKVTLCGHSKSSLKWETHQIPREDEELELWFNASDDLSFRLRSPSGTWTALVDRDNPRIDGNFDERHGYVLELTPHDAGNKDSRLCVQLLPGDIRKIRSENWQLEITSGALKGAAVLHAWIRRTNVPLMQFTNHHDENMTLTVPGTSHSAITVGAIEQGDPIYVGNISSYGPTRDHRNKPEVSAPGVNIVAARYNSASGITSMSGTSMAAPHVTGAIALLLSRMQKSGKQQVHATQILEALTQSARGSHAGWERGRGYGVLDAKALVRAF